MEMTANDMMAEIRDANLSYLMLAQQMIRADKVTAIFRLGISADIADLIEGMSNAQILKLAGGNMMLARFRFDDTAILSMLTSQPKKSPKGSFQNQESDPGLIEVSVQRVCCCQVSKS
jgi:flagellar transcriptional activator FlhD